MRVKLFGRNELGRLYVPDRASHKGQNGRLLVIGGSQLFHSSVFWSADVASRVVDLVHFASPANENNEVVRKRIKNGFWSGIVVDWSRVDEYVAEDEAILIGPGMPREEGLMEGEVSTGVVVNDLLERFGDRRWVIDGGALQEVEPTLLASKMIITPHRREFERLLLKLPEAEVCLREFRGLVGKVYRGREGVEQLAEFTQDVSERLGGVTILLKGVKDLVCKAKLNGSDEEDKCWVVGGGNEGLTKGGTGDILAGLAAAFYTKNEASLSAAAASLVLKTTADRLYEEVGRFYNPADLIGAIPKTLHEMMG